jgi:hypothetical protein
MRADSGSDKAYRYASVNKKSRVGSDLGTVVLSVRNGRLR